MFARVAAVAATLVLSPHAFAQSDVDDPEMRIQQLEESKHSADDSSDLQRRFKLVDELYRLVERHPDYNKTRKRRKATA